MLAWIMTQGTLFHVPVDSGVKVHGCTKKSLGFAKKKIRLDPCAVFNEERFAVLSWQDGTPLGTVARRSVVHRDGLGHRSVHVWLVRVDTAELLVQRRSALKDTFPGRWDVSAAGHISVDDEQQDQDGDGQSLCTARRELEEELGLRNVALEFLFTARSDHRGVSAGGVQFWDREFQDVYLGKITEEEGRDVIVQESEVDEVIFMPWEDYCRRARRRDTALVPRPEAYLDQFEVALRRRL